jgi:DUF971 family protein
MGAILMNHSPTPISLHFSRQEKTLTIQFDEHSAPAVLSYEFLRVHSPSAEVQGHHPDQAILQTGKKQVSIDHVEQVGHYAIRPQFSDGHNTGIYSWAYLHELAINHDTLWQRYLERLTSAQASRE